MRIADLQKSLRAVDEGAVLVSPRILERVIREVCRLPGLYWNVPHWKSYVVDRQLLFRHAEQADLEVEPDQVLPETVILLARPEAEKLSEQENKMLLLEYWRRLFHASIHVALGGYRTCGGGESPPATTLTDEQVAQRVEQIGPIVFEEIRTVLVEDRFLPAGADDRATYIEFAAVYFELRHFAYNLLNNCFPGIRDFQQIEGILAQDVDAAALFQKTRLEGAPEPEMRTDTRSDETYERYWTLIRQAKRTEDAKNIVRAAILRTRAARIAPAVLTQSTRSNAEANIRQLTEALRVPLDLSAAEVDDWARHLILLLDKAEQGNPPVETQLLFDLQKVAIDHEHEIYSLDLLEYLLSAGKRPIKRPLPSQRHVRILKHLRSASSRLVGVRLSDTDRNHLTRLFQSAINRVESTLRKRFEPVLETALEDVGLRPGSAPERVAFHKVVEELLDRILTYGFLTFPDLRDVVSRNQLKLPDLREPEDFVRGDPLLRLDRRLASLLDGVYRPSTFYMRLLEWLTAFHFGTALGRAYTRYFIVPFAGAFLLLHTLAIVLALFVNPARDPVLQTIVDVLHGPLHLGPIDPDSASPVLLYHGLILGGLGLFFLALTLSAELRYRLRQELRRFWKGARLLFYELPLAILPLAWLRKVITSWGFQLIYWYLILPLILSLPLWWFWPHIREHPLVFAGMVLVVSAAFNSRAGYAISEAVTNGVVQFTVLLRAGLLQGLVRFTIEAFKYLVDLFERVLFTVDEWLRFRGGDSQASLVVRTILGLLWAPIAYLARFYMIVLIEPGINPVKFPISTLAAKFIYPALFALGVFTWPAGEWPSSPLVEPLSHFITFPLAWLVVVGTFFFLPDMFGFLFWEIKENWSLFRANRPRTIEAVVVGTHGETVRGLLAPGFHSGTVPRLYARLRWEERQAYRTRDWSNARWYREQLDEVAASLHRFVAREMVALLEQSRPWRPGPAPRLKAGLIRLTTNRIRLELSHATHETSPVELEIQLRHGWLIATTNEVGWLTEVSPDERQAFCTALAGFYKQAGVDLVIEQVKANLPVWAVRWELAPEGLMLTWGSERGAGLGTITWPLWEGEPDIQCPEGIVAPTNAPGPLIFARQPLLWDRWVATWQWDSGEGVPAPGTGRGLPGMGLELVGLADRDAPPDIVPDTIPPTSYSAYIASLGNPKDDKGDG